MANIDDLSEQVSRLHQNISQFRLYSKGIVAENKPLSTNEILAVPIEKMGFLDGEIATEDDDLVIEGEDASGKKYTMNMKARSSLTCKWIPLDSNRVTAPDVRRGEEVFIYRFADSDDFYWADTGLAAKLRRLETVTWLFSANPEGDSDDDRGAEDSYLVEVSAHKKLISIHTTKKNGEPFEYDIQLNTGTGYFTIADDAGNYFELDSSEKRIRMELETRTYVELNNQNIDIYAPGTISAKADEDINAQCANFYLLAEKVINIESGGDTTVKAPEVTVDTPQANFTGKLDVTGDVTAAANVSVGGNLSIGAKMTGPSFSMENGILTCKSITASQPISAPNV